MILIKSPNNKTVAVDLNPETTTLSAVKHHIQSRFLIPLSSQRFLSPKVLLNRDNDSISDSLLLSHLGISPYSTLTLYIPFLGGTQEDEDDDGGYDENQKFDEFEGNDVGLLASAGYDDGDDDKEADAVWEEIDKRMDSKRKDRREAKLKLEIKRYPDSNPKTTEQFSDLKRKFYTSSAQDWESIPDIGLRNKKKSRSAGGPDTPSSQITSDAEISSTTKHRYLFKNLTRTNPICPSGWIEAARLEEVAGKIQAARQLIQKGCEECPQNEDVWLEACRLASPDDGNQSRALKRGLEQIPHSVRLWKALVELSTEQDARRTLLHRAVECCPLNLEFWLALARLETYDNAKKVLNTARMKLPKEPAIWIAAAKLEEANGKNTSMVGKIIQRGIHVLQRKGLVIGWEAWMKEAEAAERAGSIATCQAIIKKAIGIRVEGEENRLRTWVADAEECKKRGSTETARAILQKAYAAIPNCEDIWLAAFQLEFENRKPERARWLIAEARERVGTKRVWMKSAIVERELGNTEEERRLLHQGLKRFPSFFKLWLMLGQLEERLGHLGQAKEVYESSLNHCSSCIQLWLSLANLEEKMTGLSKARVVLAMARKEIPHNPELWLAAVRAESRHGNKEEANILMTEALQECPNSGILWAASIDMVPRPQLESKCIDAVKKFVNDLHDSVAVAKKFANDPHVSVAVAKLFWHCRKFDEARMFLNRAVTLAPDIGDFWALYYKFEIQHGTAEDQKDVLKWCIAAQPKHGERWQKIAKAVENAHQQTEAILTQVLLALVKEEENVQNN